MKQNEKEKCFEEAMDEYQKQTGKALNLKHQQPWGQRTDTGQWEMEERGIWYGIGSMLKTLRSLADPSKPAGTYKQVRIPDVTVNDKTVVDLKFTRKDGTVDDWRPGKGKGNGKTQKHDQAEINKQNNPDNKNAKAIKLDPSTCKCNGDPQPQEVEVKVPAPEGLYFAPYGRSPYGAPGRVPGRIPAPIRIPIPVPGM